MAESHATERVLADRLAKGDAAVRDRLLAAPQQAVPPLAVPQQEIPLPAAPQPAGPLPRTAEPRWEPPAGNSRHSYATERPSSRQPVDNRVSVPVPPVQNVRERLSNPVTAATALVQQVGRTCYTGSDAGRSASAINQQPTAVMRSSTCTSSTAVTSSLR
jgi:hypothetical protein